MMECIEIWSDYALWESNTDKDRKAMLEDINNEAETALNINQITKKENLK